MTEQGTPITGGCLCGKLRYEAEGPGLQTAHCHCTMCRRASGALAVTFVVVQSSGFRWTQGEPAVYRSSAKAVRRFCPTCGSQLTFFDETKPDALDINTGTLDRPQDFPALKHVWADTRMPWLLLNPELPGWNPAPPKPALPKE